MCWLCICIYFEMHIINSSHKVESQGKKTTGSENIFRYSKAHDGVWLDVMKSFWSLSGCWRKVVWKPAELCPMTKNDPLFTLQTPRMHPCWRDTDLSHNKDILPGEREKCVLVCCVRNNGWVMGKHLSFFAFYCLSQSCSLSLSLSLSVSLSIWLLVVLKMGHLTLVAVIAGK